MSNVPRTTIIRTKITWIASPCQWVKKSFFTISEKRLHCGVTVTIQVLINTTKPENQEHYLQVWSKWPKIPMPISASPDNSTVCAHWLWPIVSGRRFLHKAVARTDVLFSMQACCPPALGAPAAASTPFTHTADAFGRQQGSLRGLSRFPLV